MIKKIVINPIVIFIIITICLVAGGYPFMKKATESVLLSTPSPSIVISSGSSFYIPAENKKVTLFGKDSCQFDSLFSSNSDNSCIILDKEKVELYVLTEKEKHVKKEIWTVRKENNQTILLDSLGNSISRLPTTL